MPTAVFVHGTGVRRASFDDSFAALREGLARIRPSLTVEPCYWGDEFGSRLRAGGASIPGTRVGTRSPNDSEALDPLLQLWAQLDIDPLAELKAASLARPGVIPPHTVGAQLVQLDRLRLAAKSATVLREATAAGIGHCWAASVDSVVTSEAARRAVLSAGSIQGADAVVARACVAVATLATDELLDGTLAIDGGHREAVATALLDALGVSERGVGSWLLAGVARPIEHRRHAITGAVSAVPGDVLRYLARGSRLRRIIADSVRATNGDVVVIGHSLGGIAALECLIEQPIPAVTHLITVGSQASFLYEIDALPGLSFGTDLPAHVPRWTNLYDPRDFLAYVAAPLFPGRVSDRVVDNDAPFPRAHTGYLRSRHFYDVLDEVMA
ncbi:alpha/beta fold hydrolase [Nocardia lasii]|uniref:Alpha/beta fold hydrolase n=1 Tax=Nocardia lasii TaxID=1616107 RepID=A0ABW1JS70_9NOCA